MTRGPLAICRYDTGWSTDLTRSVGEVILLGSSGSCSGTVVDSDACRPKCHGETPVWRYHLLCGVTVATVGWICDMEELVCLRSPAPLNPWPVLKTDLPGTNDLLRWVWLGVLRQHEARRRRTLCRSAGKGTLFEVAEDSKATAGSTTLTKYMIGASENAMQPRKYPRRVWRPRGGCQWTQPSKGVIPPLFGLVLQGVCPMCGKTTHARPDTLGHAA